MDEQKLDKMREDLYDCKFAIEDIKEAGMRAMSLLNEFNKYLEEIERDLNDEKIFHVFFEAHMINIDTSSYYLSIQRNKEGASKKTCIYIKITNVNDTGENIEKRIKTTTIEERMLFIPLLKPFMQKYHDYYVSFVKEKFGV